MFDISWSELLILGVVTLIFVGPKELPRFLGQLGRYMGVVRRQANEFRAVFEQAMREAEMDQIQKEIRSVSDGVKASLDNATRSVESAQAAAKVDTDLTPASLPKALPEVTSETADTTMPASPSTDTGVAAAGDTKSGEPVKAEPEISKSLSKSLSKSPAGTG